MDYRLLGGTGLRVSEFALGFMNFGARERADLDDARDVLDRALDAGVNLIDTADVYFGGGSESLLGELLSRRKDRDEILIATKFHNRWSEGVNRRGNSRHWITRAVDASLERLRVDHIDLYQAHRPDHDVDIDETLGALSDLVRAGKIRYFGTSTSNGHQLTEARWNASSRGHVYPVSEQLPYSILARGAEREVLPVADKYRLGVLVWSPLAGGWLGGHRHETEGSRLARQPERHDRAIDDNRLKLDAVGRLQEIASGAGISLPALALRFLLANDVVSTVLLGPRTSEQLDQLLEARQTTLTADTLAAIDAVVPPGVTINRADTGYRRDFAHDLLARQRRG